MDVDKISPLHPLVIASGLDHAAGAAFTTAMQSMQLASVFDIVRMPREQFARELAEHSDVDPYQLYDYATVQARRVSRLYQEHQLSLPDASRRIRRSSRAAAGSVSYDALFEENQEQFCEEDDIAAIDSPVAYLRALYLFAGQLENASTHADRIKLEVRRPDIQDLVLDQHSTFVTRPMLDIVNDTLSRQLTSRMGKSSEELIEQLSKEHYPFSLPYNLHHHQCMLGLTPDKTALGALNYSISQDLPWQTPGDSGSKKNASFEAQKLMSGLSPQQQQMLIAPVLTEAELAAAYGTRQVSALHTLEVFKERTGLTTNQVEQLLAQGKYQARSSLEKPDPLHARYGAHYVNGTASASNFLTLTGTDKNSGRISNASVERLDRLQRMIRLQRWTGIPVAELDTLISNAMRSEDSDSQTLNDNTLRTLGVYHYLNRRYGIPPEEFAALLHDIPTSACANRVALFDQVFNRSGLLHSALSDLPDTMPVQSDLAFLGYIGAGLGLPVTPDALLLLVKQAEKHCVLKHDLNTVSILYRQARIARMFALSPMDCTQLAYLLGKETFCELLVTGKISPTARRQTDILDVLMALDRAVDEFRQSKRDVSRWCRLFEENTQPLSLKMQDRLALVREKATVEETQQRELLAALLHDVANLSAQQSDNAIKMAGVSAQVFFEELDDQHAVAKKIMPSPLAKILRAAHAIEQLPVSTAALQELLNHPQWLSAQGSATFSPKTMYVLSRFSDCARHMQSEDDLLHYLQFANQEPTPSKAEADTRLAQILKWSREDVSSLTFHLPAQCARTVEAVDWIVRCQASCRETRLSAHLLLKATNLTAKSPRADWKAVGEALMAARH